MLKLNHIDSYCNNYLINTLVIRITIIIIVIEKDRLINNNINN